MRIREYDFDYSGNWMGATTTIGRIRNTGRPKGKTFVDACYELIPEVIVLDAEPAAGTYTRGWGGVHAGQLC